MTIAQGIRKQTVYKKQTALGTPATGAGGQVLRRITSNFNLQKPTFESEEIVSHQQNTGVNFGTHSTQGALNGQISPATYKAFMQSLLRKDFAAGAASAALTTVTAATTTGSQGTFTRGSGSWITDGFKVGDVVRWTGWTAGGVNNNAKNMVIIALTALIMTVDTVDGTAVAAKAAGDSVTATATGKKTLVPETSHTNDFYTVEEFYADLVKSELYTDTKVSSMAVDIPASGNAKLTFNFMGLKRSLASSAQLTAPTAETTTPTLQTVTGFVLVNGVRQGTVTSMQFTVEGGITVSGPVVGSKYNPDMANGKVRVTGQFAAYFENTDLQTLFENDTSLGIFLVLTADAAANSDFICFGISRIKLTGDAPDDGEKGIVRTYPFVAEINTAGGAATNADKTIISIQDSLA